MVIAGSHIYAAINYITMRHQRIHTSFTRKFRKQVTPYTGFEATRAGNVEFRQFAGRKGELNQLAKQLARELGHTASVHAINRFLKQEDIPCARNVSMAARNLLKEIAPAVRKEQEGGYHMRLREAVLHLPAEVNNFRIYVLQKLQATLKDFLSDKVNGGEERFVYTDELESVESIFALFADEMREHYDELCILLQEEAARNPTPFVTTPSEELLLNLIMLMGKCIFRTESTLANLIEWKERLEFIEYREMYN